VTRRISYRNWSISLPNLHFHYLVSLLDVPDCIVAAYSPLHYRRRPPNNLLQEEFPDRQGGGNVAKVEGTGVERSTRVVVVFETFPQRKFILIADTSNSDVMRDYPEMATDFPGQVQCIFLRNTSATDSGDKFPYDTSGFKKLNQSRMTSLLLVSAMRMNLRCGKVSKTFCRRNTSATDSGDKFPYDTSGFKKLNQSNYMFFLHPDDLTNLDIANGQCYNTVPPFTDKPAADSAV
jgi:hypothetical protein